jgi:hypothetical protein
MQMPLGGGPPALNSRPGADENAASSNSNQQSSTWAAASAHRVPAEMAMEDVATLQPAAPPAALAVEAASKAANGITAVVPLAAGLAPLPLALEARLATASAQPFVAVPAPPPVEFASLAEQLPALAADGVEQLHYVNDGGSLYHSSCAWGSNPKLGEGDHKLSDLCQTFEYL